MLQARHPTNVYLIRSGFVRVDRASFGNDPPTARDNQCSTTAIALTRAGANLTLKIDWIHAFESPQLADGFLTRFESFNGLGVEDIFEKGLHLEELPVHERYANEEEEAEQDCYGYRDSTEICQHASIPVEHKPHGQPD